MEQNFNSGTRKSWILPVIVASIIMVLVVLTVPMFLRPAAVQGAYTSIGTFTVQSPDTITPGGLGNINLVITGIDPTQINIQGIRLGGASVQSWYLNAQGQLVLVFNQAQITQTGASLTFSGSTMNGVPFSGNIPTR